MLVDDDKELLEVYNKIFKLNGFDVISCENAEKALNILEKNRISVVVSDIIMPKMSGIELLKEIKKRNRQTEVIMLTAEGSISGAVEAVKEGAFSYFVKPADLDDLISNIRKAAELSIVKNENEVLKGQIAVLSDCSNRADKPFICVNCGALNENLIESELFGSEKGAYTGSEKQRKGRFEIANGGTIFFDEIGELSLNMQTRLLRVLQEKSFERVGGTETIKSDFRLITATNRNLKKEVLENRFRADLYYRINIIPIEIPPLRERLEDIPELCENFMKEYSHEMNKNIESIDDDIIRVLQMYNWPGNVRELSNVVERMVVLSHDGKLDLDVLPEEIRDLISNNKSQDALRTHTKAFEKEYIIKIMKKHQGNVAKAAEEMQIAKKNLYKKLNEYDIKYRKNDI